MEKVKKILMLIVLCALTLSLCACETEKPEKTSSNGIVEEAIRTDEPLLTVKDCYGSDIQIKKNPKTIATIFAVSSHLVAMLGDSEKIVAIAEGNTRDYLFCEMFPHILEARVAKGNSTVNIEELVKDPVPELVIINPDASMSDETKKLLGDNEIPVWTINFTTWEEQKTVVKDLGMVLGREDEAQRYIEYSESIIEMVQERVKSIPEAEKVTVYHAINELLRTDKPNTLSQQVFSMAGVHNVASDIIPTSDSTLVSKNYIALEELLQADPEFIFINGADVYDYILKSDRFDAMRAYKEEKLRMLPLGVSRWGHPNSVETPMAVLFIASTVYPDLFPDIDMREETEKFYKQIWNYELSEEQITKIIEGRDYKTIKGSGGSTN